MLDQRDPKEETGQKARAAERRNIALIGFMGSGKTTVARLLAERLGWEMRDTDTEIEREAGCRIPDLFAAEGEPAFRERESNALRAVAVESKCVIATGGGIVLRSENIALLRESSYVVWLTARPEVVAGRTGGNAASRPVLARGGHDLLTHILRLLGERAPLYQSAADLIVDTSDRSPVAIAEEIARRWRRERKVSLASYE